MAYRMNMDESATCSQDSGFGSGDAIDSMVNADEVRKQKHRDTERKRHHGIVGMMDKIDSLVPGQGEGRCTQVNNLNRAARYVIFLSEIDKINQTGIPLDNEEMFKAHQVATETIGKLLTENGANKQISEDESDLAAQMISMPNPTVEALSATNSMDNLADDQQDYLNLISLTDYTASDHEETDLLAGGDNARSVSSFDINDTEQAEFMPAETELLNSDFYVALRDAQACTWW